MPQNLLVVRNERDVWISLSYSQLSNHLGKTFAELLPVFAEFLKIKWKKN